jgi:hypothetical protein
MLRRQGADETDIMPRMEAILDPQVGGDHTGALPHIAAAVATVSCAC